MQTILTVKLVNFASIVAFAGAQAGDWVNLILEWTSAETNALHTVLDLVTLPRTYLQPQHHGLRQIPSNAILLSNQNCRN